VPPGTSRCEPCAAEADRRRGTAASRGYGKRHRKSFREEVLARDPICVLCRRRKATVADHYPLGRDELVRMGLDPDDPRHGRGLCAWCDPAQTAARQPGGWNASRPGVG
jgi:5-methylcytosine-specific restriction protein A